MASKTNDGVLTIRPVNENDLPALVPLIEAFAAHEGETEYSTDLACLRQCLFERPCGRALIGTVDGTPCAFAAFSEMFVTHLAARSFLIDSLFVLESHRGRGYGKRFMEEIAAIAAAEGVIYLEWACYRWNDEAAGFYTRLGANMLDWNMYRLSGANLRRVASAASDDPV